MTAALPPTVAPAYDAMPAPVRLRALELRQIVQGTATDIGVESWRKP